MRNNKIIKVNAYLAYHKKQNFFSKEELNLILSLYGKGVSSGKWKDYAIAASKDEHIRAFDKDSGEELWKYKLPAGGYATPSIYEIENKQYIVIACGGGKMGTKPGDYYISFGLP